MCKWEGDLIPHNIKTDREGVTITGNIIPNTRMLIIQRTHLLKVETKTGSILRAWIAKETKKKTHICVPEII